MPLMQHAEDKTGKKLLMPHTEDRTGKMPQAETKCGIKSFEE